MVPRWEDGVETFDQNENMIQERKKMRFTYTGNIQLGTGTYIFYIKQLFPGVPFINFTFIYKTKVPVGTYLGIMFIGQNRSMTLLN